MSPQKNGLTVRLHTSDITLPATGIDPADGQCCYGLTVADDVGLPAGVGHMQTVEVKGLPDVERCVASGFIHTQVDHQTEKRVVQLRLAAPFTITLKPSPKPSRTKPSAALTRKEPPNADDQGSPTRQD